MGLLRPKKRYAMQRLVGGTQLSPLPDISQPDLEFQSACVRVNPRRRSYCPVPVSFITSGLSGALSLTVTAPLIDPFTLGVNVTLNVHVAPEATVAPQGVPPEGVAAKSPLATRFDMVRVPPELLVSVTVLGALVVPTA
jgi:hypothetical protein